MPRIPASQTAVMSGVVATAGSVWMRAWPVAVDTTDFLTRST